MKETPDCPFYLLIIWNDYNVLKKFAVWSFSLVNHFKSNFLRFTDFLSMNRKNTFHFKVDTLASVALNSTFKAYSAAFTTKVNRRDKTIGKQRERQSCGSECSRRRWRCQQISHMIRHLKQSSVYWQCLVKKGEVTIWSQLSSSFRLNGL